MYELEDNQGEANHAFMVVHPSSEADIIRSTPRLQQTRQLWLDMQKSQDKKPFIG